MLLDVYAWSPDPLSAPEATAELARAALRALEGRALRRVCVIAAGKGSATSHEQYFTFRSGEGGFEEDKLTRGMHPMLAKRMHLWRLSNFELNRLPSVENVFLFHGKAHDNPKDERLFAVAEVRDLTPLRDPAGRVTALPQLERMFLEALGSIRVAQARRPAHERIQYNRVFLYTWPPLRVPAGPAQGEALEDLKRQLHGDGASADLSRWSKREVLLLEPVVPGGRHRYSYLSHPRLHVFFEGDELRIGQSHEEGAVPCAGLEQIERTLSAMRERLTDENRRAQKSEKLRKLKERAVETQIEALAARLGLTYATEAMHAKIKLYIELDAKEAIAVDVPHSRHEAVLKELPGLIKAVRDIHARGYRYALVSRHGYQRYRRAGEKAK